MAKINPSWRWTLSVLTLTIQSLVSVMCQPIIKPTCDFIESDVKYFDVRITPTRVPTDRTTYVCQKQLVPINLYEDFHAIGYLPLINNTELIHHMIMFGCPDRDHGSIHRCGKPDNQCRHMMVQWSRGLAGPICNPPDAGNRFGLSSVKTLLLQIHWNNQDGADGLQDSSGFRVFYTSQFRRYDMGIVQIGQNDLEIPPYQTRFPQTGSCSSDCTRTWLPHPIYLTRAHLHIHYTGTGGLVEVVRNGSVVSTVLNKQHYDYDKPPAPTFAQPIQVLPGDEIRVTCLYNTRDGRRMRNHTVIFGDGSDGEMCYAFVSYFPLINDFDQCIQFDEFDICTRTGFTALGECILPGFAHVFVGMGDEIIKQCSSTMAGSSKIQNNQGTLCSVPCQMAIGEVTGHPCMQGRLKKEAERNYLANVSIWPRVREIINDAKRLCQ